MIFDPRFDENLLILNFATRLFTMVSDRDMLLRSALETVADFAGSPRVAIYRRDSEPGAGVVLEGYFSSGRSHEPESEVRVAGTPLDVVLEESVCRSFPISPESRFVLPIFEEEGSGQECFCLPVVGVKRASDRVICAEFPAGGVPYETCQHLHILATVLAVSLENSALFEMALVD